MKYEVLIGNKYLHTIYALYPMTRQEIIEVTKDNDPEYAKYNDSQFNITEIKS